MHIFWLINDVKMKYVFNCFYLGIFALSTLNWYFHNFQRGCLFLPRYAQLPNILDNYKPNHCGNEVIWAKKCSDEYEVPF